MRVVTSRMWIVVWFCVWTMIARVIDVVPARITIIQIVVSFQFVGVHSSFASASQVLLSLLLRGGGVEVVVVSMGCFVAQGLVPVFANSSGRWGPVAPVVFFSFSMFVVVVVAGYLPALVVVDYLRRLPVGE